MVDMANTKIEEAINKYLIDKTWELHRRFMREVEREVGIHIPIETLISCQNVAQKWLEFVRLN